MRNGNIQIVTNMTKEYSRYVFDIGVAYREDVDEVNQVIRKVDEELRRHPGFADSAVINRARTRARPIMQWAVGREFNRRLKQAFDRHAVEIPFPHRTLYMGEDKRGNAPVRSEEG